MNCILFAKIYQVFSKKKQNFKKKYWKKSGNFVSPEKWEPCNIVSVASVSLVVNFY